MLLGNQYGLAQCGLAPTSGTTTINLTYPLINNYYTRAFSAGNSIRSYQVIRVPRYYNLIINASSSITAAAWNGSSGGVVEI